MSHGFGHRARAIGPGGTGVQMLGCRLAGQIVDDQIMTGLLQIGRHASAHHAETDEADLHCFLL